MTNNEIEKKLALKNVKPTAMRTLVYKTLVNSGKALSLADLEMQFEKVERSTIYRALKSFEENFMVHPVDDGTGAVKYAVCDDDCTCNIHDLHVHFYCTRCGRTRCMKELPIPEMKLPAGYTYDKAQFIIQGVCPRCD
ncbi:Fur family transcriptional regulator [Marinilabilia sp.]|jgi:Fur family ferric uptake transcriptional regulator|uniref:Fur family transcriptional regulator n=1 Tax=Marinilabilia sp. TaxID=2021252 RepID=UPI0025BEBEDB|nr:transcriptional repressor [Marinilabilia sp.]